jgi:hypothetical protein
MTFRADATAHSVRHDQVGSVGPSSNLLNVAFAMARFAVIQMTMSRMIERTLSRYRTAGI